MAQNETLGLVGESGCGKTTLGRAILGLIKPQKGEIFLHGKNLMSLTDADKKIISKQLQVVFQDPYGSLNPRLTIAEALTEPMAVHGLLSGKRQREEKGGYANGKSKPKSRFFETLPTPV